LKDDTDGTAAKFILFAGGMTGRLNLVRKASKLLKLAAQGYVKEPEDIFKLYE
jgi:hypothetical protein